MKISFATFGFALTLFFVLSSPSAHAATASVNITETSVVQGVPYNVSWTSSGASSCTVSGPGLSSSGLTGGPVSVTQTTTGVKTYTISCNTPGCVWGSPVPLEFCSGNSSCPGSAPGGACSPNGAQCEEKNTVWVGGEPVCNGTAYTCGGSCTTVTGTDSVTVTAAPAPTPTLNASATTIAYGGSTTLTWTSSNATSCTGTGFSTGGATNNSTGVVVTPTANTTYSISCTGLGGTGTANRAITVTGVPAPTINFSANPLTVALGSASTLTWSSTNAPTCTGTGFSTGGNPSGSVQVTPAINTTYSISCTGQGGTATASAGVGVTGGGAAEVTVFDGSDGSMKIYILPDANANGGIPFSDTSAIYAGWENERNRTCFLVDPTSYPTAWSTRSFNSPQDNAVLKYIAPNWSVHSASGNNIKYSWLTCKTNQKPDVALSGNGTPGTASITVASGTAVNLTWLSQYGAVRQGTCSAQNFATDTWVPGHWEDNWTCESSCGTGGNICASASHKPLASAFSNVLKFLGVQPEVAWAGPGGCTNNPVWVPGTTANKPFGGTTTVYPTVTTTYTYTCANAIGTDAKSITVNVPTGPQCSDGLDNDSDGTCDLGACVPALPADPGCMNATDTTEDPNPPPPPALSAAVCAPNGTSVTLDWSDTSANGYYLRVAKPASGVCPGSLVIPAWNTNICIPSPDIVNTSTYVLSPIASGTAHTYWVMSRTATGEWSTPTYGNFTCTPVAPPITASCSVSPGTIATGQNVTWTAAASGGTPPYTYTWTGSSPLSGTGNPKVVQYSTTGVKTGSVTVTDSVAASSGAVSCTAGGGGDPGGNPSTTITTAAPTANLTGPDPVVTGTNPVNLTWSSTDATSCVGTGFSTGGTTGGTVNVGPLSNPPQPFYDYQVTCSGAVNPPASDTHRVNITTPTANIVADPDRVAPGQQSSLTWSGVQVTACTVTGTNGFSSSGLVGTGVPTGAIGAHGDTFTINCDAGVATDFAIVLPPLDSGEF